MTDAADRFIGGFDRMLRAVFVAPVAVREMPRASAPQEPLPDDDRRHAAGLMRVNHVGEICAQGLYSGQAAATVDEALRAALLESGREEGDHLAWTAERLRQLGSRPSLLNPVWYAGSFAMGWLAGKAGDAVSLGFVVETEKQVEEHLAKHLETLPADDHASRAVVDAMRADEIRHAEKAMEAGAVPLPPIVGTLMRGAARVMTTTAYWI
jgi:ubiquinone biosynthesis monooxygenase Coq7